MVWHFFFLTIPVSTSMDKPTNTLNYMLEEFSSQMTSKIWCPIIWILFAEWSTQVYYNNFWREIQNLYSVYKIVCGIKKTFKMNKVQLFWEDHKNVRNRPYGFEIYLVNVKTIRTIAQIFVAFSEKLNFKWKLRIWNNFCINKSPIIFCMVA